MVCSQFRGRVRDNTNPTSKLRTCPIIFNQLLIVSVCCILWEKGVETKFRVFEVGFCDVAISNNYLILQYDLHRRLLFW